MYFQLYENILRPQAIYCSTQLIEKSVTKLSNNYKVSLIESLPKLKASNSFIHNDKYIPIFVHIRKSKNDL